MARGVQHIFYSSIPRPRSGAHCVVSPLVHSGAARLGGSPLDLDRHLALLGAVNYSQTKLIKNMYER